MAQRPQSERISDDGLRFLKKKPAATSPGIFKSAKSCYVCSRQQSNADGVLVALFGRTQFFCSQECKEKIFKAKQQPSA